MKITLEIPVENKEKTWKHIKILEQHSRRGNRFVKHDGKILVYKNRKPGTPIVTKKGNEWVQVGRIDIIGTLFLGAKDEMSYAEWQRTPEAREAARSLLRSLRREA